MGQSILINNVAFTVAGVAPAQFFGVDPELVPDFYVPLHPNFLLGAQRRPVLWMVLREVLVLAAVGLAISVPIALGTSRFVASFLFGIKPNDPLALGLAVTILLLAALLAGGIPTRRASRIDPMTAFAA